MKVEYQVAIFLEIFGEMDVISVRFPDFPNYCITLGDEFEDSILEEAISCMNSGIEFMVEDREIIATSIGLSGRQPDEFNHFFGDIIPLPDEKNKLQLVELYREMVELDIPEIIAN